ncbi:nucleosome assembly protein 1-like 1 [Hydra vulgaris]|uniref:Nucleosome assembly protein 1-like 1 n=1 Tax=Hydra vulgaris TaxID=6087 RepID=A0ABM4DKS8_HYDVU
MELLEKEHVSYIETLPKCVRLRINALKNIQVDFAKIEGKFYEEAHLLEMKYAEIFKPLYDKRKDIVNVFYELTEEESKWVEPSKESPEEATKINEKSDKEKLAEKVLSNLKVDENTKGIPEFWLTAMKNVEILSEMIQEHDEPILKHLIESNFCLLGKQKAIQVIQQWVLF